MAYMSQEKKAKLSPAIKAILKKYGMKGTLSVRHHSTLVLSISAGDIDIIGNYVNGINRNPRRTDEFATREEFNGHMGVNEYWYHEHFTGKALNFLGELIAAMNDGNHDNSRIQEDYADVGWYIDIDFGNWKKPYVFTGKELEKIKESV